jgi:small conductance mechanosensitive channel
MKMEQGISTIQKLINTAIEFIVNYSFQVLGAILILVVGFLVANWVRKVFLKTLEARKLDITLSHFLGNAVYFSIVAVALIIALGKFGITIAPFIAVLGATAFGVTYAIQGPLSNYGAGFSIILSRPFVVGDTVTVAGISGIVSEVKLACTVLTNEDGVKITIPNKHIVGEVLHNSKGNKVVEGVVGVSYSSDPKIANRLIYDILAQHKEVSHEPAPQVGIQSFGDSSVNIGYRYWIPTAVYFKTLYAINGTIFEVLKKNGIEIPFPQREVRISGARTKENVFSPK